MVDVKIFGGLALRHKLFRRSQCGDARGNYLGKDNGRIIELTDAGLILKEVLSDGGKGYLEQEVTLSLVSDEKE